MKKLIKVLLSISVLQLSLASTQALAEVDAEKVAEKILKDVATKQAKDFLKDYLNANPPSIYTGGEGQFGTETLQGVSLFLSMVEFANAKTDNGRLFAGAKIIATIAAAQPYVFVIIIAVQIIDGILASNHSAKMLEIYADIARIQRQIAELNLALAEAYQKELDFYSTTYDEKLHHVNELAKIISEDGGSCKKIQDLAVKKEENPNLDVKDIEECVNALRDYAYASQDIYYLSQKILVYLSQLPTLDEHVQGFVNSLKVELDKWQEASELTEWYWQLMELNSVFKAKMWQESQQQNNLDQWQQEALLGYCQTEVAKRGAAHIANKINYRQQSDKGFMVNPQLKEQLLFEVENLFVLVADCKSFAQTEALSVILEDSKTLLNKPIWRLP